MTLQEFARGWNKKGASVAFDPNDKLLNPDPIPLGIVELDRILAGGIPRGRTTLLIGEPSSGKTLLAQIIIRAAQHQSENSKCIFIDAEHTFDARWFEMTGVDVDPEHLVVIRPEHMEQSFDIVSDALLKYDPDVIVIDSLASLVPRDVMNATMTEKDFRGLDARKITAGVKKNTTENKRTALVFIQQMRTDLSVVRGNPEAIPGGKGLKHWSSAIIRCRRGKWLTDKGIGIEGLDMISLDEDVEARRIGFMLRLRVEKSKVGAPFQECEVKAYFSGAVDTLSSLVHMAIARGIITASGSWYLIPGSEKKIQGIDAVEEIVRSDAVVRAAIELQLEEV